MGGWTRINCQHCVVGESKIADGWADWRRLIHFQSAAITHIWRWLLAIKKQSGWWSMYDVGTGLILQLRCQFLIKSLFGLQCPMPSQRDAPCKYNADKMRAGSSTLNTIYWWRFHSGAFQQGTDKETTLHKSLAFKRISLWYIEWKIVYYLVEEYFLHCSHFRLKYSIEILEEIFVHFYCRVEKNIYCINVHDVKKTKYMFCLKTIVLQITKCLLLMMNFSPLVERVEVIFFHFCSKPNDN